MYALLHNDQKHYVHLYNINKNYWLSFGAFMTIAMMHSKNKNVRTNFHND